MNDKLNRLRENSFYLNLLLYVAVLPFSEALTSIAASLLLLQALVLASWKHPSVPHGSVTSLLLVFSVFAVFLAGTLRTENPSFAAYELKKNLFWIVIPASFFFSPRLPTKRFIHLLALFCLAVFLASLTGISRLFFKEYFQITDFRDITLVSHIRFSFQIILSILITLSFLFSKTKLPVIGSGKIVLLFLLAWYVCFLVLLKSITGWAAFLGTSLMIAVILAFRMKNRLHRMAALSLILLLVAIPVAYVLHVWNQYNHVEKIDPQLVDRITPSGNPYYFDFTAPDKENGHLVWVYFCEPELRKEWNKISQCSYDSIDAYGYPYSATLIRYLTGKGLRKDSSGVVSLTMRDIRAIENSIANPIHVESPWSPYSRIYDSMAELDHYFRSGDPNKQSVSQRIEYVKASLWLIRRNCLWGIGTGNWMIRYREAYREMNSKLNPENQGPSHNQYLNYLVKFGVVGFFVIVAVIMIPVFREGHSRNILFGLFLVLIAIANLGDANLETHMGLSFFCFFYSLFLWHSPDDIRNGHFGRVPGRSGTGGS